MNNKANGLNLIQKSVIVIIGHMGSGKSTIGKLLARKLEWKHFDSDLEIEKKQKQKIIKIFETKGENYFRSLEESIISGLLKNKNVVISLGGGSILNKKIRRLLKKRTISIFLKVDINTLVNRLRNKKRRPLLIGADIRKTIYSLNAKRLQFYKQADTIINNSEKINETVNKLFYIVINKIN